ncbi:glycosyltransferase family 2 protein [Clostridium ljungdahlii]|uniref:glycosyltransferase family 2 protein n=1 Tax=Clostridium ljungdahlii TaxID=1538 RepID=UPI00386545B3
MKISSNTLVLNEKGYIDGLIKNLIDAKIDEIIFLDGGSTDGTYEKLLMYEKIYPQIVLVKWNQPISSQYRQGWREKDRRNLMLGISTGDYILFIDADERIDINIKKVVSLIDVDGIITYTYHFWRSNKTVRVNNINDMVWSNQAQLRIIKRNDLVKFNTVDKNGLHCYLQKKAKNTFGC